jgi:hypothetical protein
MKTKPQRRYIVIGVSWFIAVLLAACGSSAPASTAASVAVQQATSTSAPTNTPTATATPKPTNTPTRTPTPSPTPTATPNPAGEPIPLKPLTDLTSLNATVKISANGTLNGKPVQGELDADLTANNQKKSQIVVTGDLLGDAVVQIGGSAVSLFRPSQATVYTMPDGTYIVLKGLFDVCIKPKDSKATETMSQLSPQSLMTMLTGSDVARGKLVGEETLNGTTVEHYVINGPAFLAAAQQSTDPNVRTFGEALRSADEADLYVDSAGGYPVAFRGSYSGAFEPLKFDGDFSVQIDLTGVNENTPVSLPKACNNPISR